MLSWKEIVGRSGKFDDIKHEALRMMISLNGSCLLLGTKFKEEVTGAISDLESRVSAKVHKSAEGLLVPSISDFLSGCLQATVHAKYRTHTEGVGRYGGDVS